MTFHLKSDCLQLKKQFCTVYCVKVVSLSILHLRKIRCVVPRLCKKCQGNVRVMGRAWKNTCASIRASAPLSLEWHSPCRSIPKIFCLNPNRFLTLLYWLTLIAPSLPPFFALNMSLACTSAVLSLPLCFRGRSVWITSQMFFALTSGPFSWSNFNSMLCSPIALKETWVCPLVMDILDWMVWLSILFTVLQTYLWFSNRIPRSTGALHPAKRGNCFSMLQHLSCSGRGIALEIAVIVSWGTWVICLVSVDW